MRISTLCNVVESVLLFLNFQCEHLSKSALKQLQPKLTVAIDTVPHTSNETTSPSKYKLQIRVLVFGLGAYFLDGAAFIKQICHFCPDLQLQLCSETGGPVMEVLCRCTGQPGQVTRCCLTGWTSGQEPVVQESLVTRPSDLHPAALLVNMMVIVLEKDFQDLCKRLQKQLHMIHLLNPEVLLSLLVRDKHKKPIVQVLFETACMKTLYRPPVHLIVSVSHYCKKLFDSRLSKLQLCKGDTQTLPNSLLLQNDSKFSLKLFSMVAVVPGVRLKRGKKIPLNKLCQKINIFVFGPHSLPLIAPGSMPGFPLSLLADWDCYGLSLSAIDTHLTDDDEVASPSYVCEITNSRRGSTHPPSHNTLLLFLFLDDPSCSEKTQLSGNIRWRQGTEVVHRLRAGFQELIMSQSKKFHQAVHSALNKIACNYGSHSKTKSIMGTALPLLAEAVASIVQNSTEETFKTSCLQTLQVDSVDDVRGSVEQRLWRIAKKKLAVTHPTDTSSRNPDEPTSPELAAAVQRDRDDAMQACPALTPFEDSIRLSTSAPADNPCYGNTEHLQSTTINPVNSQSLFQARISRKQQIPQEQENHTKTNRAACNSEDDDDTCFDSLCELSENIHFGTASRHVKHIDNQPSQQILDNTAMDYSIPNQTVPTDSQPSQALLGTTNYRLEDVYSSQNDDDDMSISSFEELEDCDSPSENMLCVFDQAKSCEGMAVSGQNNPPDAEIDVKTEDECNGLCAIEGSLVAAALPDVEARQDNGSDEEWDRLLTHQPTLLTSDDIMPDDFELLANHAVENTNLRSPSISISDVDIEWT